MSNQSNYTSKCKACGREREPHERFSARGKCPDCGVGRMAKNARQLNAHNGEAFEQWRRRVAASVGAVLLDDL